MRHDDVYPEIGTTAGRARSRRRENQQHSALEITA
jgi:hypothetical protein